MVAVPIFYYISSYQKEGCGLPQPPLSTLVCDIISVWYNNQNYDIFRD